MEVHCMGGHEIFLHLKENEAFHHCPGHRQMDFVGRIERSVNSITVYRASDDAPMCRVDLDGLKYSLTYLSTQTTFEIKQVNNPWRTWLPKFLPEE